MRGSIVGTRNDLAEALAFADDRKVQVHVHRARLEDINSVFDDLKTARVHGRIVLDMS